jgi:hypothetical protein
MTDRPIRIQPRKPPGARRDDATWARSNVRKLENVIERLVLRREEPETESLHLELPPYGISLEAVEKELIKGTRKVRLERDQSR